MGSFINFSGRILPSGSLLVSADNRGFRAGDGVFETIRVKGGRIPLWAYHFTRLQKGCEALGLAVTPGTAVLEDMILQLCTLNEALDSARVRLTVFRGDAGLEEDATAFVIQAWPYTEISEEGGLKMGVFPGGCKACDVLSNLKSNNYLIYSLAASYARKQGWDEGLVLNAYQRVADCSITNVFYIKDDVVVTPSLSEGGVSGVMRRWLLDRLPGAGWQVEERAVLVEDLIAADEVFVTNALRGVRWVREFQGNSYVNNGKTKDIKQMAYEGFD